MLQGVPQADVDARIDQAISYLVNARCVVFVDVGILLGPVAEARRFNNHLTAAVQSHPNIHVYDWAADFQQHPDWTTDTVHLKAQYIEQYAARSSTRRVRRAVPELG